MSNRRVRFLGGIYVSIFTAEGVLPFINPSASESELKLTTSPFKLVPATLV